MKLRKPKSCTNCKYLITKDLSMMEYEVRVSCVKSVWKDEKFYGQGDYEDSLTDNQVCDLFVYKKED